jgi:hypothetical protein
MHYESAAHYKVGESCKVVGNGLAAGRAVVAAWQLSWCGNLVGLCQRLTLEERALTSSALGGRLHGRLLIRTGVRARRVCLLLSWNPLAAALGRATVFRLGGVCMLNSPAPSLTQKDVSI